MALPMIAQPDEVIDALNVARSDGSTASYYQLPASATELQDLISFRNMNAQDGEIFRAIYRKGKASHSDELRDARKVLFYAQAEVKRLEKYVVRNEQDELIDMAVRPIQQFCDEPTPKPSIYDSEEMKKSCAAALEALNRFPHKKQNDFLAPDYTAEEFKANCEFAARSSLALEGFYKAQDFKNGGDGAPLSEPTGWQGVK